MKRVTLICLASLVAAVGLLRASGDEFDHEAHDGLFPVCDSCHAGIISGDSAEFYPTPDDCATCHNEDEMGTIDWSGPSVRASNVTFSHEDHAVLFEDFDLEFDCGECHGSGTGEFSMTLQPVSVETCETCHDDAEDHYEGEGDCSMCHVPLVEAPGYTVADLQTWPSPASHQTDDFWSRHGALAHEDVTSCTVCHARESCTQCHRNGERIEAVQALMPDARVSSWVEGRAGVYPMPASHDDDWFETHGAFARESIESCANCHVQAGCLDCHSQGEIREVVGQLPKLRSGEVALIAAGQGGGSYHPSGWVQAHGMAAGADPASCQSCHSEPTCESCHDGIESSTFHGFNYVERHGSEAYQGSVECSSCHSVEVFCRQCHGELGIAGVSGSFHDRQPLWLLNHGQAARQELTGCVSCHAQTDCTKCHAVGSGPGVNPHGPGFDPGDLADANAGSCLVCHPSVPGQ